MDFMNLAEVPEVDSVKDGDTVFVVRDGEVCRVAKDKVGGGAGNYVVNVATGEAVWEDDSKTGLYITTPVPGLLEAARNGATVTIAVDLGAFVGEGENGNIAYITCLGVADMKAILGEAGADLPDGMAISGVIYPGGYVVVGFLNGYIEIAATLAAEASTLRSKLGGGKSVQL